MNHTLKNFDAELTRLYGEIRRMGELAVAQLKAALFALQSKDAAVADAVVRGDAAIDALEREVGHDVLRLLALRQPMARDLREVYGALKISADIERIGDLAANIAKRAKIVHRQPAIPVLEDIEALLNFSAQMVGDAVSAYHARDAAQSLVVRARDAELDERYTQLFQRVLAHMTQTPDAITAGTHLLFIAKNLERVGDHATNIVENTIFIVTGEDALDQRVKRDGTTN
jgi:phosphate transport system protein